MVLNSINLRYDTIYVTIRYNIIRTPAPRHHRHKCPQSRGDGVVNEVCVCKHVSCVQPTVVMWAWPEKVARAGRSW